MAIQTDPRNGITYNWDQGDSTYKDAMDANLRKIGSILNITIINTFSTPPVSPSNGDAYIVGTAPTGDWENEEKNIAIWFANDETPAWRFFDATAGMTAFVTSGTQANQLIAFNGTAWSANGFAFTFS